MINTDSGTFFILKSLAWGLMTFLIFITLPNWLKARENKKKLDYWNEWLKNLDSHSSYLKKYPTEDNLIRCFYCQNEKQTTQVKAAIPNEIEFRFLNNIEDNKQVHYVSYYCSKCQCELFRHSHLV